MKLKYLVVVALLALAGCVQTAELDTSFNPTEHSYALAAGRATVAGQAFLRRNDGVVVYGAGGVVLLLPWTAYTREVVQRQQSSTFGVNITNMDDRLSKYVRQTQADGEGRFVFTGVPDGAYLVSAVVTWMAGDARQGGEVSKIVQVRGGESVNVIVTR